MHPKTAVIYVRVSTTEQADRGVSLDNQERACHDWAFRNQVQTLKVFREEGKSAKTLKRPEMQAMLEYLTEHSAEIDYLIIYQIDRLTRNKFDFADLMRMLAKLKIELRDSSSNVEATESDELIQAIQAALAEHDNKQKSRRVIENMKRHASEGYRMHQAPFGLRNIRNELGRPTVEPIEPIASKIATILTEYANGSYPAKAILLKRAQEIDLKQPNGKPLSYQFLDKMLRQPLYAGMEKSSLTDEQLVPSVFEGIVPEWVYYTNQSLLDSRRANKAEGYKSINPDYPLRRFVICEACGQPLRGSASTGRGGKKYPRYHCTTRECHSSFIKPDDLHKAWKDHLNKLRPNDNRLRLIETIIVRVWREEVNSMRFRRNKLRESIDALSEERIDAAEMVATGKLTPEEKNAISFRIKKRIGTMRKELNKLDRNIGTKEEAIDYAVNYISNARHLWIKASPEMKQVYQRMIYPEGLPYSFTKKQFGTAKMSALYTLATIKKDPVLSEESTLVIPRGVEPLLPG